MITNAALRKMEFIIRNSKHFTAFNSILCLFNSLIRSKWEFALIVCDSGIASYSHMVKIANQFLHYL